MWKLTNLKLRLPLAALCLMATAAPALALDINLTFALSGTSSVSDFGANTNSMTSAVAYAAQQLDNAITDPITVNVTVYGSTAASAFGASYTYYQGPYTYPQILNALTSNATNPAQQIGVSTLPATDPSPAGGPYEVPNAEAKALGLLSANNSAIDGSVTFGSANPWAFNPNNRAVPGEFDFIGVAYHELTEAMGRVWGLDTTLETGSPHYVPYDLYRYDGGTTTRDMTNNTNLWFSINGGKTDLNSFNYQFTNSSGTDTEDPTDWGIGVANQNYQNSLTNDAFNAYSAGGVVNNLSSVDLTVLNVMGFHLSAAAMSGGTWAGNASGSWTAASNWTYPIVPSGITVYFAGVPVNPNAPITVTLDGNQSAAGLVFNVTNGNGYTLAQGSGGTLSLGTPSGGSISVVAGSHAVSAPVTLQGPLTVNVASGSALQLTGAIGEANAGTSFTFNGPGLLKYSAAGTFTGSTNVNGGTLQVTGGLLPAANENVGGVGGATAVVSGGTNAVSGVLYVGYTGNGGNYYLSGSGYLRAADGEFIGYYASGGFQQSGGTHSVSNTLTIGAESGGFGSYSLSGGSLFAQAEQIGILSGVGEFAQSAGTHSVAGTLTFGANSGAYGSYDLALGGVLIAESENIGVSGTGGFTQTDGEHSVAGALTFGYNSGSNGSYGLSGGSLFAQSENIGLSGAGSFTQSGGVHSVTDILTVGANSGANGSYSLSGGSLFAEDGENIGVSGSGNFTQSGGTNMAPPAIVVGDGGVASYSLSGGLVSTQELQVGGVKNGTFTQTGGSVLAGGGSVIALLVTGTTGNLPATYNLQSGLLSVTGQEYIGEFGSASFVQSGGTHTVSGGTLLLGTTISGYNGSGTYNLSAGYLSVPTEFIAYYGTGNFTQSGGTHAVASTLYLGYGAGGSGAYNLSGNGMLSTNVEVLGNSGSGSFLQSGGTHSVFGLYLGYNAGSSGSYQQYSSTSSLLSAGTEFIGDNGTGNFQQYAGSNSVSALTVGYQASSSGTYYQSGGILSAGSEYVGFSGTGLFQQQNGIHTVTSELDLGYGASGKGTYDLNAGILSCQGNEAIGYSGTGTFLQSGGNHNVSSNLSLGYTAQGNGTYVMGFANSVLTAGTETIGYSGTGSFFQNNGANSVNALYIALGATSSGMYQLNAPATLSAATETVGGAGTGTFYQNGGTNSVSGSLILSTSAFAFGQYDLYGGLLSLGGLSHGTNVYAFTFGGGTIQAGSSFSTNVVIDLATLGSSGVFDSHGNSLTLNGFLFGNGGLQKVGAGTLILTSSSNNYVGPTTLIAGTLEAANGNLGSATSSGTVTLNGGVLAAGPAGGTILGPVLAGNAAHTIAPGANLSPGQYGTLNLRGGLTTNLYTRLLYNLNLSTSIGNGSNGDNIYGGDLINLGGSALTVSGGNNQGGNISFVSNPIQPGDYRLFQDAGGSSNLSGFNLPSQSGMTYALSTTVDPNYIDLVAVGTGMGASSGTWTSPVSGSWSLPNNWSGSQIPSSGTVYFPGAPSAPITVSLNGNQSAGALVFSVSNANGYTLAQGSGGALSLGTPAGATITVTAGAHNVAAPVVLQGNLTANVSSGASLQLSGVVSESTSGLGLSLNGPGLLIFSGTGAYSGNATVNSGTLQINSGGLLPAASEYVGTAAAAAYVVQNGGSNVVSAGGNLQGLIVGYGGGNSNYTLNGGLLNAANEFISYSGYSVFTQTGGTNQAGYLSVGTYYNGNYYLSGGLLSANIEDINDSALNGAFTQSGGTNQVATNLTVGFLGGGSYYMSGGVLSAVNAYVGYGRGGNVLQSGGNFSVSSAIYVAYEYGSQGSYYLSNSGLLTAPNEYVGYSGNGTFNQSGGTNSVRMGNLYLGYNPGGSGTYTMSSGVLDPVNEYIGAGGTGIFYQLGGTNTVTNVSVSGGYYLLSAGLLQGAGGGTIGVVNGGFQSPGTLNLGGFAAVVAGTGALLDLSGNILNISGASLSVGSDSLLIVPPGFNPANYASYSNAGLTHTLGTALNVSAGTGFGGWGTIADPVNCQGTILATQGGWINLNNGLFLADPGQVNLGTGTLIVNDTSFSGMTGGSLVAALMVVGSNGTGSFPQTGGNGVLSSLYLGYNAADSGTYLLSGTAQLSAGYEVVGLGGSGTFTQAGGTHAVGTLYLAEEFGSAGTYNLNGGLLSLSALYSYPGGAAAFNFSGGTFQAAAPLTTSMPITLSAPGNNGVFDTNGNALTLNGQLSGPGGLIVAGSGMLTLGVSNSYTGTTLISNGTLILGDSNALSGSTFDTTGTGALSFQGGIGGFSFGGLQGSGSLLMTDASGADVALTVGLNGANTTFSGSLSDSNSGGNLTKVGTGTLVLGGTNTYGGGTIVLDGTLSVTNNEGLADGSSLYVGDPALLALFGDVSPAVGSAGFSRGDSPADAGTTSAVPEPSALALVLAAAVVAAAGRRSR
jgi:fibronectin-binding autotransporter adhesin